MLDITLNYSQMELENKKTVVHTSNVQMESGNNK